MAQDQRPRVRLVKQRMTQRLVALLVVPQMPALKAGQVRPHRRKGKWGGLEMLVGLLVALALRLNKPNLIKNRRVKNPFPGFSVSRGLMACPACQVCQVCRPLCLGLLVVPAHNVVLAAHRCRGKA